MADTGKRNIKAIGSTLAFVLASRAVGMFREVVISIGYGLSRATDTFYQLSALPTYTITFVTGPFSTAYIAWANRSTTPAEAEHLAAIAQGVIGVGVLVAALAGGGTVAYAAITGAPATFYLDACLIAPSCLAVALIGLGAAVQNARGRFAGAQGLLFANNAVFVGLLAVGALARGRTDVTLIGAFAIASLAAATLSARRIGLFGEGERTDLRKRWRDTPLKVRQSLVREFLPQLAYASMETGGFIATQAVVLLLASNSGAGVASAASLAARICLTANGLFVNPLSNIMMVHLAKREAGRRRFMFSAVGATVVGLAVVALALAILRGPLVHVMQARGKFTASNASLLASLIPAYGLWLIAQGLSMVLARLSFTLGRARLFTIMTIVGYGLANIARFFAWRAAGMPAAVGAGAAVEILAALTIFSVVALTMEDKRPQGQNDPQPGEADAASALLAESVSGAEPVSAPEPAAHDLADLRGKDQQVRPL